ncbi:hypothetical protein GCM10023195_23580 [Actinoallomurus liliacearum]|uniref:Uncharacterized protein n=1 Tax=Actinoallomurus liliacearum TaxID=1080073 RepID=A0ABP8TEW0_9ACTN
MSAECARAAVRSRVSTRRAVQPWAARCSFVRRTTALSAAAALLVLFDGVAVAVDRVALGVALLLGVFRFGVGLLDRWDAFDGRADGLGSTEGRTADPSGLGKTATSRAGVVAGEGECCCAALQSDRAAMPPETKTAIASSTNAWTRRLTRFADRGSSRGAAEDQHYRPTKPVKSGVLRYFPV